ncbi:MAG: beta-ketoacyl synthase N-terminal-like domain-containing protein [Verrucomicrobiota bacterium]
MQFGATITGAEVACALGNDLDTCLAAIRRGESGLRPLAGFFGEHSGYSSLLGGWIPDRSIFAGRRYGLTSNAAVRISQAAVGRAGWTGPELRDAAVFVGSSRGNAGELFGVGRARRPIKLFRASNLMHSEIAAAVSIELSIRGPWQVFSNGCASGLDALGYAVQAVHSGFCDRALAVAIDLPLIPELLSAFQASGVLSRNNVNDPYHAETSGFLPAEAAVAVAVERGGSALGWARVGGYSATSDAFDSIGLPPDGAGLADCVKLTLARSSSGRVRAICPHATGTQNHARAELAALNKVFGGREEIDGVLLKPYTGHTLGASGLLDVALLAAMLRDGLLLPNRTGLSGGLPWLRLATGPQACGPDEEVLKLSVGMGGHNAAIILRGPAGR